jgi:hypothetical protein
MIPTATFTPITIQTTTPNPTSTSFPIIHVTLGSPFASDCGDGVPRIWSNNSFNGLLDITKADGHHGNVGILPPEGCNAGEYPNLFIAPASGVGTEYGLGGPGYSYYIKLPQNVFPEGLEQVLQASGIDFAHDKINSVTLHFGHLGTVKEGKIQKGEKIGNFDRLPISSQSYKLAYQVFIVISGKEYAFSPTLFVHDGASWACVKDSPYDCQPTYNDYAP